MKNLIIIILVVTLLCVNCFATGSSASADDDVVLDWGSESNSTFRTQLERFHYYDVIPKSFGTDPDMLVTRRMALHTITAIENCGGLELMPAKKTTEYIDVEDKTFDADLTNISTNFFYGKINQNGEKYADLDSNITKAETIVLILRILSCMVDDVDEIIENKATENNVSFNEGAYIMAEEVGLIHYDYEYNHLINSMPNVSADTLEEPFTFREFVAICNRALYMPIFYGYGCKDPTYYINLLELYKNN